MLDYIGSKRFERELADDPNRIEYAHDLFGNFTFLNKAGELISGYSAQEARQMNISQLVTPEFMGRMHEQLGHMVEQGLGSVFEIDIIAKDGRPLALEVSTRVVVRDGQQKEIQGIAVQSVLRRSSTSQLRPQCLHEDFVVGNLRRR